jgi:hypothetical protein
MRTLRTTRLERRLSLLPALDEVLIADDEAEAMASRTRGRRRRGNLPMSLTAELPLRPLGSGPPCDDCGRAGALRGRCQLCRGTGHRGNGICGACDGRAFCRTCRGSGINPPNVDPRDL